MSLPFDAVLFDCDGVLVDSEAITNGVLSAMLVEGGWAITPAQTMAIFLGKSIRDEADLIEARTGKPVTDEWMESFQQRRNAALERELVEIPGAAAFALTSRAPLIANAAHAQHGIGSVEPEVLA